MQSITIKTPEKENITLYKETDGLWYCPVCGSLELKLQPRTEEGGSFEMCSCGFEFGFDDEPAASAQAVRGVVSNWDRWRQMLILKFRHQPEELNQLRLQLAKIGCESASTSPYTHRTNGG